MKNLFRIVFLVFITSTIVYAQKRSTIEMDEKHTIYKENFTTNINTTLVLNLNNTSAQVINSPDDKVYIEYTIEFKNVRKKIKERQLKHLIVSGKKEGDKITYSARMRSSMDDRVYNFEELLIGRLGEKSISKDSIRKVVQRKSLDSVLQDVKLSELFRRNKIREALNIKPSQTERRNRSVNNLIVSRMVIKIPKNIDVRATLENSNIVFMDDFYNRATMNVRNSKLRFKSLGNALNIFDCDNGYFNAEVVSGGSYNFANAKEVRIGYLSNSLLNTEFTKIEIGEIGSGNEIVDFNSKFWLYNFSKNFENFNMNTEYSEVNLFYPKSSNYYLETFGHDTVHYRNGVTTEITASQKNKSSKMMLIGKESNPNKIKIDTVHGIIRFGEDFIDVAE
jgi:hypothetical protein